MVVSPEHPSGYPEQGGTGQGQSKRAPGLDGVRALAVLAVMGYHEGFSFLRGGFLGVDVFFVLSGFLITDLLARRDMGLKEFWIRRARRLLPALAVMLVVVTSAVTVLAPSARDALRPALLAAATYTSNWYQMLHHVSYFDSFGPPPPLQHLWSLAIEEQFYLLWPLLLWLLILRRPNARWFPVLLALLGAALSAILMALLVDPADPSGVYYGTDTHASALLIGAALALACPLRTLTAAPRKLLDRAGVAGLLVLAVSVVYFSGGNLAVYPGGLVLAAVAAAAVIAAAASPGRVGTALGWAPLRWIGTRSYGMYLWHWPVIALTLAVAGPGATGLGYAVMETAVTVALAALSWHFVEAPILANGLRATVRSWYLDTVAVFTWPGALRHRAGPVALMAAVVTVAGFAGYGAVRPAGPSSDAGLIAQVAAGQQISVQSQQTPPDPATPDGNRQNGIRTRITSVVKPKSPHVCRPGHIDGYQVTAIGDSVMLASAAGLEQQMPGLYLDAKVDRQMETGVQIVQGLAASGKLRKYVVVGLGTNGTVTAGEIWDLRKAAGGNRWLILVNIFGPMPWTSSDNRVLVSATRGKPRVAIADWHDAIAHRTYLLWDDGIHPRPSGGVLYASVVASVIRSAGGIC